MNTALQKIRLYARELRLPTLTQTDALIRDAEASQWTKRSSLLRSCAPKSNSARKTERVVRVISLTLFPM